MRVYYSDWETMQLIVELLKYCSTTLFFKFCNAIKLIHCRWSLFYYITSLQC